MSPVKNAKVIYVSPLLRVDLFEYNSTVITVLTKQSFVTNMSVSLTGNTSVASDVVVGGETVDEGVISTLKTTPVETSGSTTVEQPYQNAPIGQLANFFQRRTLLQRYTFTSTNTPNTSMGTFNPHSLFFNSVVMQDKSKNFHAFRGTLRIEVTSTFPSGTYGLYCLSAIPQGGESLNPAAGTTIGQFLPYRQCMHVPHAKIRVENATDAVINLPFVYPYDYAPLDSVPEIWKLEMFCLQPVSSAMSDSTLSGNCTVYASFLPDLDLIIPVQQGKKSGGTSVKHAMNTVSTIAGAMTAVPIIGELAAPVAAGAAAVSSILDWFGFTRTTHQKTPEPFIPRLFSNVANVDVEDTSEVCALSVSNTVSFDPRIGGGEPEDPGAFASVFQHWTQVDQFTWTNAQVAGTVIGSFNVSPFYTNSCVADDSDIDLTAAGFVGLPFQYWRGDMEYMVMIPVSMFHRGKIQFVWTVTPGLGSSDPTNQLFNIIMDVSAQEDLIFTVGYSKIEPTCRSNVHGPDYPPIIDERSFNGQVSLIVVNQLQAPVDTAPTTVRIYARASPNMKFGVPKSVEYWHTEDEMIVQQFRSAWVLQGAIGDGVHEETVMELVPSSGDYPACELLWGEEFKSVRALMQKIDVMAATTTSPNYTGMTYPGNQLYVFNHFPNQGNNFMLFDTSYSYVGGDVANQFTFSSWYSYLFVGIAGSTRYKLIVGGNLTKFLAASALSMDLGTMTTVTNAIDADVLFPNPITSPDTIVVDRAGYEFTIPYYSDKKFYHCRTQPLLNVEQEIDKLPQTSQENVRADIVWTRVANEYTTPTAYYGNKIYRGLGPDLRLVQYRFPPSIKNSLLTDDPFSNSF